MASHAPSDHTVDEHNAWRLDSPGAAGWKRTARADDPNKFFIVSADCHVQEPNDLWVQRMPKDLHHRLPGVSVDPKGEKFQKTEGFRPIRIRDVPFEGEDRLRNQSGKTPEERLEDLAADGVDCEVLFPNKGLAMWATPDAKFSQAMCRAYNEWAWEVFGPYNDRLAPMACIATGDIEGAIAEVQRTAKLGFKGLSLPCKPVWGAPNHEDAELQPAGPRSAVGRDSGRRHAVHVPRLHRSRSAHRARQRRRGHQLCRALAGADDGADRQHLCAPACSSVSETAFRQHRSRHRLGAVGADGHGRGLP